MIYAIVAMTTKGGIGINNELPWRHNKVDMNFFSRTTRGNVVVMGRRTWESLGSTPLPQRTNYVVTTREDACPEDMRLEGDMGRILEDLKTKHPNDDIYVMGGADIYDQAWGYVDEYLITFFMGNYECDTFIDVEKVNTLEVRSTLYEDNQIQIMRMS